VRGECNADEVEDKNANTYSDGNGNDSIDIVHHILTDANARLSRAAAGSSWFQASSLREV
jgi:hypothetical protein